MPEDDVDDFGESIGMANIKATPELDFCPYKKRRCMCWDQSECILNYYLTGTNCQIVTCIWEIEQ